MVSKESASAHLQCEKAQSLEIMDSGRGQVRKRTWPTATSRATNSWATQDNGRRVN